jgi:hypothetical protein
MGSSILSVRLSQCISVLFRHFSLIPVVVGKSKQPTAGSFVRPGRASDKPLSFLEAAHDKYVSELEMMQQASAHATIEISGKIVEEVGFEKIRRLLAQLHELRIVLLDGMRMKGVLADQNASAAERQLELQRIREICPKITELDMSRNLLQGWKEVTDICLQLGELRVLKLKYVCWIFGCMEFTFR